MPAHEINAAAAGTWTLGDLTVNRIGFGAKRLTGSAALDLGTASDRDRVIGVLRRAIELGVNHIDTAAFYPTYARAQQAMHDFTPLSWANELINRALAPYPDDLVITTKVGPADGGPARPDQLRGQVEESFQCLYDYLNQSSHHERQFERRRGR
jgi:pyridoxine 4-dehydrogenase